MTSTTAATPAAGAPAGGLLDRVRGYADAEAEAARAKMAAVVAWAAAHPGPRTQECSPGEVYADHEVELAGPGTPGVSEFALVELAAALGKSARAGRNYVGDALEIAYRLPRLWEHVREGHLEAWRAQMVAQRTRQLSSGAAEWVDAQVAHRAARLGPLQLGRVVEEAITLFDPDTAVEATHAETYVTITPAPGIPGLGLADLAHIDAILPLPDALALEQAIATTARDLLADHPDHTLNERRALALGRLADNATSGPGSGTGPARALSLVVHLDEPALAPAGLARVHTSTGIQHLVTVESVAAWCVQPGTKVTIRPVIDLNTPITCTGYTPSPSLRQQVMLLSPTCAFPYCTMPAERCDDDHITAWAAGGKTSAQNLGPLCRLHHRVKTFGDWTYDQPTLGTYHWTSPHGHRYHRNRDGTTDLGTGDGMGDPGEPHPPPPG